MGNNYGYLPIPKNLYFNILQLKINPNERKILQYIIGKIYEWPELRKSNTIELSCRYIAKAININHSNTSRSLISLENKGIISKKNSHTKGIGSLISLNMGNILPCESFIEDRLNTLLVKSFKENNLSNKIEIIPQYNIPETIYRVDFLIRNSKTLKPICIIECDGHDFHEKTKEQAIQDKKRDRVLSKKGYVILRFTGSEINNDINNCLNEIINFVREAIL